MIYLKGGNKSGTNDTHEKQPSQGVTQGKDQIRSLLNKTQTQASVDHPEETIDLFLHDVINAENAQQENQDSTDTQEHGWPAGKKKSFTQKDMKGKQVYLEDTGEKIGTVFDTVLDSENNLIGYKVKDNKSETILSFPLDQFDEDKNGLIFIPNWYVVGQKTIEKLEFKDRITPELFWLIKDNTISTEELYQIFVKHDDRVANYIHDAVVLREQVNNRLKILEKERLNLKETLMDLTEKRLIKDIDRREFSEIVMEHRRKVNVVDINIKKCKDLLDRLQHTSFGLLSTSIATTLEQGEQGDTTPILEEARHKNISPNDNKEDAYKEKYLDLKSRYDKLQVGYNELKNAVEKLLTNNEPSNRT